MNPMILLVLVVQTYLHIPIKDYKVVSLDQKSQPVQNVLFTAIQKVKETK
jgi:hypothetical protein